MRAELSFPFQDAGFRRSGFGFGNVPRVLQRDGKRGVRQRILRSKRGECKSRRNRLLQATRVAQGANQTMMRLEIVWIGGDGCAEASDCGVRQAFCELLKASLRESFRFVCTHAGHDIL